MQSSQDPHRAGDFDMAKLHKSLRQQHQHSLRQRSTATKLTPAEIRSLNISVASSNASNMSSPVRQQRVSTSTPPSTPDHTAPSRQPTPARNGVSLPTPPHSPDDAAPRRQNSSSGTASYIHSPTPRSHSKADFALIANNSRPASASSYRGMPTYRGPEITKTGSISMLRPSPVTHQIVDNPLSQFSRPRQSRGSVSPTRQDRWRHSISDSDTFPVRNQSLPATTSESNLPISPSEQGTSPDALAVTSDEHTHKPSSWHNEPTQPIPDRVQTAAVDRPMQPEPHLRFSWGWRRSLAAHRDRNHEIDELKKNKRRTVPASRDAGQDVPSIAYETTGPGIAPEPRASLRDDLPSSRVSMSDRSHDKPTGGPTEFEAHPAVRPLTAESGRMVDIKGKGKERETHGHGGDSHDANFDDTAPACARCSCCGRLRKPDGNRPLTPVLENENLKTNLAMEIERTDNTEASRRRSGSATRPRYTPIIPMMLAEGNTVQARIPAKSYETFQQQHGPVPLINERGDIIAPGNEPIALIPKQLEEQGRKFVRFSSLHFSHDAPKQAKAKQTLPDMTVDQTSHTTPHKPTEKGPDDAEEHDALSFDHLEQRHDPMDKMEQRQVVEDRKFFLPMPEGDASDLMAAMNGIDIFFAEKQPEVETQRDERSPEDTYAKGRMISALALQPNEEDSAMALSSENAITQVSTRSTSDEASTASRTVSFEPNPVEQPRSTSNTPPGSIYLKSALKRRPESCQTPPTSSYTNPSSTGFTTKPKGTAQFLLRTNGDTSPTQMSSGYSTPVSTFSKNVARDGTPHRHSASIPNTRVEPISGPAKHNAGSRPNSFIESNTASFNHSSVQPPRRQSQDSNTSAGGYIFPMRKSKEKKRSNLVESVLAATNRRHETSNFMNDPKK